jgi:hypothetical protein
MGRTVCIYVGLVGMKYKHNRHWLRLKANYQRSRRASLR